MFLCKIFNELKLWRDSHLKILRLFHFTSDPAAECTRLYSLCSSGLIASFYKGQRKLMSNWAHILTPHRTIYGDRMCHILTYKCVRFSGLNSDQPRYRSHESILQSYSGIKYPKINWRVALWPRRLDAEFRRVAVSYSLAEGIKEKAKF